MSDLQTARLRPTPLADLLGGEEGVENAGQVLGRDPAAGVPDADDDATPREAVALAPQIHDHAARAFERFEGVRHDVEGDLTQHHRVSLGAERGLGRHDMDVLAARRGAAGGELHGFCDDLLQVNRLERGLLLAHVLEQTVDDAGGPLGVAERAPQILRVFLEVRMTPQLLPLICITNRPSATLGKTVIAAAYRPLPAVGSWSASALRL
jgi:hypothetical protein